MPNTTVTIKYRDGTTRQFVASDDLEESICKGEMYSVTTLHSDLDEEMLLSKMYVGNPVAAMGHMLMLRRNAENIPKEFHSDGCIPIVIETITSCIQLMINEITSHQSGMSNTEESV